MSTDTFQLRSHSMKTTGRHRFALRTAGSTVPRPKKVATNECKICLAPALNVNFGCISCESCKVFFRRAALKDKEYLCSQNYNCWREMTIRKCIACRLQRCLAMGMRREMVYLKSINRKARATSVATTTATTTRTEPEHEPEPVPAEASQPRQEPPRTAPAPAPVIYRLSPSEQHCLWELRKMAEIFPQERELLKQMAPIELIDPIEWINKMTIYINILVAYAKRFEAFRGLNVVNQTKLMKHFFDYFLTVGHSFNFSGDFNKILMFADEGHVLLSLNWGLIVDKLIQHPTANEQMKEMIVHGHHLLAGDEVLRDIMFAILLFQPNDQLTSVEYVQYYSHFYSTLLKRYLVVKHQSQTIGLEEYHKAITFVDICKRRKALANDFFASFNSSQLNHLVAELYDLV